MGKQPVADKTTLKIKREKLVELKKKMVEKGVINKDYEGMYSLSNCVILLIDAYNQQRPLAQV